ncbi:MAG: hypothetical protein ABIH42_03385 [Planctomycetota bacterium]
MAIVTWINAKGKERIPSGNFTLTLLNGFEHGTGQLQFDSRQFSQLEVNGNVEIIVNFENNIAPTALTIKDLYVDSYTRKTDSKSDSIYTVHLKDRRFKWKKYGEITLSANQINMDGRYKRRSLNTGQRYSWKEIVLLCITAMGESENLLNAGSLPDNPFQPLNIEWRARNAACALRDLLEPANFTVAFHYDGKFSIVERNQNTQQTLPAGYGPKRETGKLFSDVPDSVLVVGGPTINQTSVELEACAIDSTDGEIKSLSEISYLCGKDRGLELATNFASLSNNKEAQSLARQTVGRLWRIPQTGCFIDDKSDVNFYLLPVLDESCVNENKGSYTIPLLHGAYFEKGEKSKYKNYGEEESERNLFPKGWAVVDRKRGVVKTGKICGVLTNTEIEALPVKKDGESVKIKLVPPKLTFTHHAREQNGSIKYWRYKEANGEKVMAVHCPCLSVTEVEGEPVEPLYSEILRRSREIASELLSHPQEAEVEFGTYAGVQPLHSSGTIVSVTWTADSCAGYTHYTYNGNQISRIPASIRELPFDIEGLKNDVEKLSWKSSSSYSHADIHPTDEELRVTNVNKHGPIVLKRSENFVKKLRQEKRRDDTESNIFAELTDFDEEHQEAQLDKSGPAEELNWEYRDHSPEPDPELDSQDKVWAIQLISDDKYMIETPVNRSTEVVRVCDENKGDIDDIWRIRAVPGSEDIAADLLQRDSETREKIISKTSSYRTMWLINTVSGGEGGWITDVSPEGLALTARSDEKKISPARRIGQIADIVILTDDDEICVTKDGDTFTYANVRHDAHFHKSQDKDGRIHFTDDFPGIAPIGVAIKGVMVCDSSVKNTDTALGKESGQWRPQVKVPLYFYAPVTPVWYPVKPPITYGFPVARLVDGTSKWGQGFPKTTLRGECGEMQAGKVPLKTDGSKYPLRIHLEYGGEGEASNKTANFKLKYRIALSGDDISSATLQSIEQDITLEANAPESKIQTDYFEIPGSELSDNCLVVIDQFYRDTGAGSDDFNNEVIVMGYKTAWGY